MSHVTNIKVHILALLSLQKTSLLRYCRHGMKHLGKGLIRIFEYYSYCADDPCLHKQKLIHLQDK